jgi:hypothetical protein
MASALGCSLFDSMCLEIGRRNVAFEQAQQTRIGRRSNRRTPVRSGSFPSAHLSDAQLLPNSRDYAAPHKVMSGHFWLADGELIEEDGGMFASHPDCKMDAIAFDRRLLIREDGTS